MLDEYLEFSEYSADPSLIVAKASKNDPNKIVGRLRKSNICAWEDKKGVYKGKYTGLKRALTIIARHAYFEEKLSPGAIAHLLKCYCFGDDMQIYNLDNIKAYKYMNGWLIKYLDIFKEPGMPEPTGKTCEEINKEIAHNLESKVFASKNDISYNFRVEYLKCELTEKKSIYWVNSVINNNGTVNDADSIYFDEIIADAINQGQLRKCFIALKVNPSEHFSSDKKSSGVYDKVLKLVAAYMLSRESDEAKTSFVSFAAYSNWVNVGCAESKKVTKLVIPKIKYNGLSNEQIFHFDYIYKMGKVKLYPYVSLSDEWIEKYQPEIIPHEELEEYIDKGYYVYGDQGCSKALKQKK